MLAFCHTSSARMLAKYNLMAPNTSIGCCDKNVVTRTDTNGSTFFWKYEYVSLILARNRLLCGRFTRYGALVEDGPMTTVASPVAADDDDGTPSAAVVVAGPVAGADDDEGAAGS